MKTVDLTCDMRPWRAGDAIHLEDELADRLVATGEAENPRPFPPGSEPRRGRPPKGTYLTKGN